MTDKDFADLLRDGKLSEKTDENLEELIQETFHKASENHIVHFPTLLPAMITEKQSRNAKKEASTSRTISIIAIVLSVIALCTSAYFSYTATNNSKEWQTTQTEILREIKNSIADPVE